jgi:hypothetical protein
MVSALWTAGDATRASLLGDSAETTTPCIGGVGDAGA